MNLSIEIRSYQNSRLKIEALVEAVGLKATETAVESAKAAKWAKLGWILESAVESAAESKCWSVEWVEATVKVWSSEWARKVVCFNVVVVDAGSAADVVVIHVGIRHAVNIVIVQVNRHATGACYIVVVDIGTSATGNVVVVDVDRAWSSADYVVVINVTTSPSADIVVVYTDRST